MLPIQIIAYLLGGFGAAGTLIPFLRYDDWWIRDFDYPRVQLSIMIIVALVLLGTDTLLWNTTHWVFTAVLLVALLYQGAKIIPYTPLWNYQVKPTDDDYEHSYLLSLLMSNVLQKNDRPDLLLNRIQEENPDLVLTLETNQWWQDQLDGELEDKYPYTIKVPQENRYGMHLYSKFELRNEAVNYHVSAEIPSIYTEVKLPDEGPLIRLYGVHPSVPSPSESDASTERDGELATIGKLVEQAGNERTIVAGDLNDVAWSHSTRLFQRISGLLDPRRGRGFYATFHAKYWLLRWPLDHVFHSPDFTLSTLKRLAHINSDHFPVFVKLAFQPGNTQDQERIEKKAQDDQVAERTIRLAKNGEKDTLLVEQ